MNRLLMLVGVAFVALVGCQTQWVNPKNGIAIDYQKKDGYVIIGKEHYEQEVCAVDREYQGNIDIPASIDGLPVKEISKRAFSQSNLSSVAIPSDVTKIGEGAFSKCNNLTSVIMANDACEIGKDAFSSCKNLKCVFVNRGGKPKYQFGEDTAVVELDELTESGTNEIMNHLGDSSIAKKIMRLIEEGQTDTALTEIISGSDEDFERLFVYNSMLINWDVLKTKLCEKESELERIRTERAERRAKEEAERIERERLEAERKAKELQSAVENAYIGFITKYWDGEASVSYDKALKGEYENLSNYIYIAEPNSVAMIEAFAEEKMPNASVSYEKAKERAMELQQVYNEDFPSPASDSSDKYPAYCKLLDRLSKARTAYHRAYKEIAHFYFQYKFGIVTQDELVTIDEKPIIVDIDKFDSLPNWPNHETLEEKESAFAAKYMPESYATYQLFLKEYDELSRVYLEAQVEREQANAFLDKAFEVANHKGVDLTENINKLTSEFIDLYMQHRMGDKDSEALAKIDHQRAEGLRQIADRLPTRVREETLIAIDEKRLASYFGVMASDMVKIPGRNFKMQRTEVTQRQWEAIMGDNPSSDKDYRLPADNISWNDAQEFIKRLNNKWRESGVNVCYRLPTEQEWEYCCRAGSKGDWGKRANGQEGPLDVMGWYSDNSDDRMHPVAHKEPNSWGLYDMHGNAWEWTSSIFEDWDWQRVARGGCSASNDKRCTAGKRVWGHYRNHVLKQGLRLVCEDL